MSKEFDIIIVGSGITGAVISQKAKHLGLKHIILERRGNIGGNCRDEKMEGIHVHKYGAHVFHTSNEKVWKFVNKYTEFNDYIHLVHARYSNRLFHLPFNLCTFYDIYGEHNPTKIRDILEKEHLKEFYDTPNNLEEHAINLVGRPLFETLIKGYTEKQWGRSCSKLPSSVIERIPIKQNFSYQYFDDKFQGIPKEGYTKMIERMLHGSQIVINADFNKERDYWLQRTKLVYHTGMIDEFMKYKFGELEYRSLFFDTKRLETCNYQGCSVINETAANVPYTRIIEHKHFSCNKETISLPYTYITKEFPQKWKRGNEAYYPITDEKNKKLYDRYKVAQMQEYPMITFCGRLGDYKYYDMDDAIERALNIDITDSISNL